MVKTLLTIIVISLAAGLFAQPYEDDYDYQPKQKESRISPSNRSRGGNQQESPKSALDGFRPSNKLEMKRPVYRSRSMEPPPVRKADIDTPKPKQETETPQADLPSFIKGPVNGPGNPSAPPLKREYPEMPAGNRIYECRFCHYIYYTTFMPDISLCEVAGHYHEWHLIGEKGSMCYHCLYCNTYVCSSKTPLRVHCGLETKHVWEFVGQLSSKQQEEMLDE